MLIELRHKNWKNLIYTKRCQNVDHKIRLISLDGISRHFFFIFYKSIILRTCVSVYPANLSAANEELDECFFLTQFQLCFSAILAPFASKTLDIMITIIYVCLCYWCYCRIQDFHLLQRILTLKININSCIFILSTRRSFLSYLKITYLLQMSLNWNTLVSGS